MKVIKSLAFLRWQEIPRCQDVKDSDCIFSHTQPEILATKNRIEKGEEDFCLIAISHRWESHKLPDPTGSQLREAQSRISAILKNHGPEKIHTKVGVFYDYCSLFQKPRTDAEAETFRRDLQRMHLVYAQDTVVVLSQGPELVGDYLQRAWCFTEYFIALSSGTLIIQDDQEQLDNDMLRSMKKIAEGRQSAWIESKRTMQTEARVSFYSKIIRKVLSTLAVTNGSDKNHIQGILVRFLEGISADKLDSTDELRTVYLHTLPDNMSLTKSERAEFMLDFDLKETIETELTKWNSEWELADDFDDHLADFPTSSTARDVTSTTAAQIQWWRENYPEEVEEAAFWYVPSFVGSRMDYDKRPQKCQSCGKSTTRYVCKHCSAFLLPAVPTDPPACRTCGIKSANQHCSQCSKKLCEDCICKCITSGARVKVGPDCGICGCKKANESCEDCCVPVCKSCICQCCVPKGSERRPICDECEVKPARLSRQKGEKHCNSCTGAYRYTRAQNDEKPCGMCGKKSKYATYPCKECGINLCRYCASKCPECLSSTCIPCIRRGVTCHGW